MSYLEKAKLAFPKKSELEIEQMFSRKREVEKLTGHSQHEHRLKAMERLFPDRVQIDWYKRKAESFHTARMEKIKEIGWSGATNSIKTSGLADLALTLWWEAPDTTSIYIASPFRTATETNLWARIIEQFNSAKDIHAELPGRLIVSQAKIIQFERNPLSFIQVTTVDDLGKLVGKKSRLFSEGLLLVIIDEAPNLPNNGSEMISVLNNLRGVPNFFLIYAGNFADPGDFMGQLAEPVGGYEAVRGQEDTLQVYRTKRRGIVYRFDGHDSENYREGRDRYEFITTLDYLRDLAETSGGTASPGYMRFGRSWPVLDVSEFRVTSPGKIEAGGAEKIAHFTGDALTLVSFCDPGFGGDPCVIQDLRVGIEAQDGRHLQVCELMGPPIIIPIDVNKHDATGKRMSPEGQIVAFHKAHAEALGIPPRNCGFDGSMRAGIVHQYGTDWSLEVLPIDSQGDPSERTFDAKNSRLWKDEVFNCTSEHWFAAGLLIQSGQLRGLIYSPAAKEQLCKRPWAWKGDRKQIQPKREFKKANLQKSPNEADALNGGIEIARRRGLQVSVLRGQGIDAIRMMQEIIRARETRAAMTRILGGNKLPPGRLHGIRSQDFHGRARLHS